MRKFLFFIVWLLAFNSAKSQTISQKLDTIGQTVYLYPISSITLIDSLVNSSKELIKPKNEFKAHLLRSNAYAQLRNLDSFLFYSNAASAICKKNDFVKSHIDVIIQRADNLIDYNSFVAAHKQISFAKQMADSIGDSSLLTRARLINIKNLVYQDEYQGATLQLNKIKYSLKRSNNSFESYNKYYYNVIKSVLFSYKGQNDSAFKYTHKARFIASKGNDVYRELLMCGYLFRDYINLLIDDDFVKTKNYTQNLDSAKKYYRQILDLLPAKKGGFYERFYEDCAILNRYTENFAAYETKIDSLFGAAEKWAPYFKQSFYNDCYNYYLRKGLSLKGKGEEIEANKYFYKSLAFAQKHINAKEALALFDQKVAISEIEEKYENDVLQAENAILAAENEKVKARNRLYIVIAVAFGLGVIVTIVIMVLVRKNLENQKQLAEAKTRLRERELEDLRGKQKINRLAALLEGQEKERTRIAADLHDGIGSLLASVKHHFQVVESVIKTDVPEVKKAYEVLDDTAIEVRRISHNMASKVLQKFGLESAVQDIAQTYSQKSLRVKTNFIDLPNDLKPDVELNIFRIIQELLSNVVKHAYATLAVVQVTNLGDELSIIVEDNGKGYDTKATTEISGIGLNNIKLRLDHLHGTIEVDSSLNHGTTILINVPLKVVD
ncbi:MAG: sensor histidine kinase [Bacteroidia bacterium]